MKLAAPAATCVADCPTCGSAVPLLVHSLEAGRIRQFCDACSALLCVASAAGRVTGIVDLDLSPQDCPDADDEAEVNPFEGSGHLPGRDHAHPGELDG